MMSNLGFNAGGYQFEPVGQMVDPLLPIYKTEPYTGLIPDDDLSRLIYNFSGNQLGGFQNLSGQNFDPQSSAAQIMIQPIEPSGIYTANASGAPTPSSGGQKGAYSISDVMSFIEAMGRANFGDQPRAFAADMFTPAAEGTFNVNRSAPYAGLLAIDQADGQSVPIEDFRRVDTGEPYSRATRNEIIRNRLAGIDESR